MLDIKTFFFNHGKAFWFFGGIAILMIVCFWQKIQSNRLKDTLKISGVAALLEVTTFFVADMNIELAVVFSAILMFIIIISGVTIWIVNKDLIMALISVYLISYLSLLVNYLLTIVIVVGLYKLLKFI